MRIYYINTRNCLFFQFTEIIFLDYQTLAKVYFKRRTNQSITANLNYGNGASTYGLWDGVGVNDAYDYQLLICDTSFYSGFFVSGYTQDCYKQCSSWCGDLVSPPVRVTLVWPSTPMANEHSMKDPPVSVCAETFTDWAACFPSYVCYIWTWA